MTRFSPLVAVVGAAIILAAATASHPGVVSPVEAQVGAGTAVLVPPSAQLRALHDFGLSSYADALAHAQELPVKGRAPRTGYARRLYGKVWSDDVDVPMGRNGCRTREDILRRDLVNITTRPGDDCTVESGTLWDPYTGKIIEFQRGPDTSPEVQIDHVVAMGDSWVKGAQEWDFAQRQNFANDPRNLLAVSGAANQAKGAGDTATWLPPNKAFRCEYVTRQVEVKRLYGLWVTAAERDAMVRILSCCTVPPPAAAPQTASTILKESDSTK